MPHPRLFSVAQVFALHAVVLAVMVAAIVVGAVAHVAAAFAIAGAIAVTEVVGFVVLQTKAGPIVRRLADATALVEQSRDGEAATLLDTLAAASRWMPNLHALVLHRRAGVYLATGELDRAEALDRAIVRSRWLARPRSALYIAYPTLCSELAVIAALKGDPTQAAEWRARAHAAVTDTRRGTLIFMDAVLLAKAGQHAEAQRQILAVGAAGRVPTSSARVVRWILAFAAAHVEAPAERAADVAKTIDAARGATREVLAWAPWWPELAAFVRERGAVMPAVAPAVVAP